MPDNFIGIICGIAFVGGVVLGALLGISWFALSRAYRRAHKEGY